MATEVIFPRIDAEMIEGKILEWKKKEGDWVEKGEVLFIIETEKVTFEVEASASGILSNIMVSAGAVVVVGTVVAFILFILTPFPRLTSFLKDFLLCLFLLIVSLLMLNI